MVVFRDQEAAEQAKQRLEQLTHLELGPFFELAFEECADPDRALINLERWLQSTANPGTYLAFLQSVPKFEQLLMVLLAASQPVADALIQNPELASLLLEPESLHRIPTAAEMLAEGQALVASATSYSHALDRIRYLKQRWTLPIVLNDLAESWGQEAVWRTLSDLADTVLELSLDVVWKEYALPKGLEPTCPVMVVAFGKLGGHEVNYSSDVDLVYVLRDDPDEKLEKHAARFCELFGRALADRMGRGSLYRVDLRLRPFGNAGPICPTMRAVEAYYRSHAELWEAQALIRSRPVAGQPALWERWRALVEQTAFRKSMSEMMVETAVDTRDRIEEIAEGDDLKRGRGGIRDVEFLTQILQMIHGHAHSEVRTPSTSNALRALTTTGHLALSAAQVLIEAYAFLRQLEHRCQLVDDQQTHTVPESPEARAHLAHLMGYGDWQHLATQLDLYRWNVRELYNQVLRGEAVKQNDRAEAAARLGTQGAAALAWFDRLPESEEFYNLLLSNESSLTRVRRILDEAPALVDAFQHSLALTESLISGEIEEPGDAGARISALKLDASPDLVAKTYRASWAGLAARWSLEPFDEPGRGFSEIFDALLVHLARRLQVSFDIVALGSYANRELNLTSDADLIFLVREGALHPEAETQAQHFLALLGQIKRHGAPVEIDLRLRPEGGKGLLVRTYAGLEAYELENMEMWERFALGNARLVHGDPEAERIVIKAAYALPLTPERLRELVAMKKRIETERVAPQHWKRDVKLGYGGLGDLEWFVHLHEMRYPTATKAGEHTLLEERLRSLARAQLINAIELEELLTAREHLLKLRTRISLLNLKKDILPENPDKLDHLAQISGHKDGNDFLAYHTHVIETVRALYLEGLERLKA